MYMSEMESSDTPRLSTIPEMPFEYESPAANKIEATQIGDECKGPRVDGEIAAAQVGDKAEALRDKRHRDGRLAILGSGRVTTSSEGRLRELCRAHFLEGAELYALEQHALAAGCFNDAKFALLLIAGLAEEQRRGRKGRQEPAPARCVQVTDRIDSVRAIVIVRRNEISCQPF